MKKRISLLLALALVLPAAAAFAVVPGGAIGDVLYTDVVATIDGFPIRSYNIAGETYVVVEDLADYGFSVSWLPDEGRLVIDPTHAGTPDTYTAEYMPEKNTHPAGTPAMKYLYTEITTWIGEQQIVGYNIGGFTCCRMDDLAEAFAETYVWDPETITLKMTTKRPPEAAPAAPALENTVLIADTSGRVSAAEAAVAAFIDDHMDFLAAMDGQAVSERAAAVWQQFGTYYSREITGSRMDDASCASVFLKLWTIDFPTAFRKFHLSLSSTLKEHADNTEDAERDMFTFLGTPRYFVDRTLTLTVTEDNGALRFVESPDLDLLYDVLNGSEREFIRLLETQKDNVPFFTSADTEKLLPELYGWDTSVLTARLRAPLTDGTPMPIEGSHVPVAEAYVAAYIDRLHAAIRDRISANSFNILNDSLLHVLDSFSYSLISSRTETGSVLITAQVRSLDFMKGYNQYFAQYARDYISEAMSSTVHPTPETIVEQLLGIVCSADRSLKTRIVQIELFPAESGGFTADPGAIWNSIQTVLPDDLHFPLYKEPTAYRTISIGMFQLKFPFSASRLSWSQTVVFSRAMENTDFVFSDPEKVYNLFDALTGSCLTFLECMDVFVVFQKP